MSSSKSSHTFTAETLAGSLELTTRKTAVLCEEPPPPELLPSPEKTTEARPFGMQNMLFILCLALCSL
ncbi:hypothetical protein HanXRQr2_Chr11g0473521 [Helianthus annuus]|uniref:Uncharacterized protein n=1 Tax=Helianthus annuus TaxID=4232 RepID=A0A9K3HLH3_HELAN|nr:hypothetical protein HanXRQr2_Chr11g0473521 [Helianthus annuus]KAJ0873799.1 hypothetical protein HanPSC8_Chr11g0456671 [Helianthus annuus]